MPIRAMLFDMDGLLIDTEDLHMRAFARTATQLGLPSQPKDYAVWIGKSSGRLAEWLHERVTPKVSAHEILCLEQEAFAEILLHEKPLPLPGVSDMLDACEAAKLWRGLVSSSVYEQVRLTMEVVLTHLRRPPALEATFHAITTGDRVQRLKPAPDPYLRTADLLGLAPGECLVFEDSPAGVASARAAGCHVVAIPNMYLDSAEIVREAHAHFKTLQDACAARVWEKI